jgi:hypothetical protein
MPAHGNSSLHHPSCAQVQRQHQQVGGSCRFFPASRHSHPPHQRRLRTLTYQASELYMIHDTAQKASASPRWTEAGFV